ncbi:RnfABCDGE type electron transport complex subunit G [Phaeodactylibacter xiamenensis]|uniref:RnfABCDGE type electron transport complex subunit G n=1 Tax=Phaeodactylibacter xiamenensis TaxID=1524460 RepID=UPI003CCBC679
MSETITIAPEKKQADTGNSNKMLFAMVGIGLMCALLIVLTYEGTKPIIQKNKAAALEQAIFKVLPGTVTTSGYYWDGTAFTPLNGAAASGQLVYAGFSESGQLTGFALPAVGLGYAGEIRVLYGYDPAQEAIVGFYVLESKETPGLGDKIEKDPAFKANFEALSVAVGTDGNSLKNKITYAKSGEKQNAWEVDGITGATISSEAVTEALSTSTAEWVPKLYEAKEAFKPQTQSHE